MSRKPIQHYSLSSPLIKKINLSKYEKKDFIKLLQELPTEIQYHIFAFFSLRELNKFVSLSRDFKTLIRKRIAELYMKKAGFLNKKGRFVFQVTFSDKYIYSLRRVIMPIIQKNFERDNSSFLVKEKSMFKQSKKMGDKKINLNDTDEDETDDMAIGLNEIKFFRVLEKSRGFSQSERICRRNDKIFDQMEKIIKEIEHDYRYYFIWQLKKNESILCPDDYLRLFFLNKKTRVQALKELKIGLGDEHNIIAILQNNRNTPYKNRLKLGAVASVKMMFKVGLISLATYCVFNLFLSQGYNKKAGEITLADCGIANLTCLEFKPCLSYLMDSHKNAPCDFEKINDRIPNPGQVNAFMFPLSLVATCIIEYLNINSPTWFGSKKQIRKRMIKISGAIITALIYSVPLSMSHALITGKGEEYACYAFCNKDSGNYLEKDISLSFMRPFLNSSVIMNASNIFVLSCISAGLLNSKIPERIFLLVRNSFLRKKILSELPKATVKLLEELESGVDVGVINETMPLISDKQTDLNFFEENDSASNRSKSRDGCWTSLFRFFNFWKTEKESDSSTSTSINNDNFFENKLAIL